MKKIILFISLIFVFGSVLVGCNENKKNIDVEATGKEIAIALDGKTKKLQKLNAEEAKGILQDLTLVEEYSVYGSMMSPIETVGIFKVKDGNLDKVKEELEKTKKAKKEAAFYPADKDALSNDGALKVVSNGNYVGIFILPDYENASADITDEAVNIFNNKFK